MSGCWRISVEEFIDKLSRYCLKDDVIVPSSSGRATEITLRDWVIKQGQRILHCPGLGSMGFALPMAIGASFASNRRVICIEGDGSLQLNLQELELLKRYNLNIKLFILNNGGYDSIRSTQTRYFKRLSGCDRSSGLTLPSIREIAKAYGIITAPMGDCFKTKKPTICEVICTT